MLLNCHSFYSLRYGTFSEKELLQLAADFGYATLALTDINTTSACLNFMRLAPDLGIRPVLGIDCRQGDAQYYVLLAKNNAGFREINTFLSEHLHTQKPFPKKPPVLQNTFVIYPYHHWKKYISHALLANERVGLSLFQIKNLCFLRHKPKPEESVLLHTVSFRDKRDYNTHKLLRAIHHNTVLSKLTSENLGDPEQRILPKVELLGLLANHTKILHQTQNLLQQCNVRFDFSDKRKHKNKKSYTGSPSADSHLLRRLCRKGLRKRYTHITPTILARIDKELKLIQQTDFVSFFLMNWDIVEYAKRKGYYHVGRGSGANSIVAYLLGITDVDPIQLDLYFERFMNLYRSNPPDFDIDFSWRDRQDVTRYIFERFGANGQVALLATYNTFQHSGAVRELGKVMGLPKHEIDRLSRGKYDPKSLDKYAAAVHVYAQWLVGKPNHLSVHSAGILIAEESMHNYSATSLPPKGFPTVQFDMHIAEDVGLYKYDILGQRGLGKIKDAVALVRENQPDAPDFDVHDVQPLLADKNINALVSRAECMGCFYVESPAMRMLLRKLSVDNYLGLVAASSIIRPGVSKSGMMREYILRHKNPSKRKEAHPILAKIMPETYGVMVYQEDVIKVAHHFGGLDLGQADVLRRGMSGKFRSRQAFQMVKESFFANCKAKGYADERVQEVWMQIESFAGYAFAKGHSASYAVESYQSLFLKCYYPLEFMVAVLNNGGGFYRAEIYIRHARTLGATIKTPKINQSKYECSIAGKTIYLGFMFLQGFDARLADRIVHEREQNGCYASLEDFVARVAIGKEQLECLIRIQAFSHTGISSRALLWKANLLLNATSSRPKQIALFDVPNRNFELPQLPTESLEIAFDQIEIMGFSLCSPFRLLEQAVRNTIAPEAFPDYLGQQVQLYGYLVTAKPTRTHTGKRMYFGTFLTEKDQWIDTVHFPPVAAKYPFRGPGVYALWGKVVVEFGFYSLEVHKMERLAYVQDVRFSEV